MLKFYLKLAAVIYVLLIMLLPSGLFARGVSPYLPLNKSTEIERQIERVLILAGRPVMTRPIAVATVLEALHDARKKDEALCREVEDYLQRYLHDAGLTHLRLEVTAENGDSEQVIPNQYGRDVGSSWEVSGSAFFWAGQYALINLGGVAYEGGTSATGSMLSLGIDYAQLDIGYRDHWLSPFTDSSMLISTEAPTMPSMTLSNYRPISRLGLFYQVFLAKMSESSRIAYKGRYTTGNPRLAGVHLRSEPVSGFSIGINRQLQYSGGERDKDSFSDLVHALYNPRRYDNIRRRDSHEEEFGNQQVSLTARMLFPDRLPFSVYFEYAGEDTSRYQNYYLGNVSFSLGIDFPVLWDRFGLTYETTEWQNAWYVHSIYQDGMTNKGTVIGHWFGDLRQSGGNIGGMSHILRLDWTTEDGSYIQGRYRTLANDSYSAVSYKRMHEIGLSYSRPWHGQTIGAGLYAGRDVHGDWYGRLSASVDFLQDWRTAFNDVVSADMDSDDSTKLLLDLGLSWSRSRVDRGGYHGRNFHDWSENNSSAHVGLGVRRAVSEHNDLGVRIEWDRVTGHDLLSVRILDYRYRMGKRYALGGFLGVGRYDWGTPAYGWYLGAGPQLIDVLPNWDLCLDGRLYLKMVRDKLLPSDPATISPDVFNIASLTVYLSRRF